MSSICRHMEAWLLYTTMAVSLCQYHCLWVQSVQSLFVNGALVDVEDIQH